MERITHQERIRPGMGIAFFAVIMLLTVTVCAYMQLNWGIAGLVLTEVLYAAAAVLFCVIRKVKIKEVFPVKKVTVKDVFGCIFLLIGVYLLSILSIMVMTYLFPFAGQETIELSQYLYGRLGLVGCIVVIGLLPAVCEEAVYRGVILSTLRGVKKEWIAIVTVGLLFSINHLSVLRGPFTFMLGMALAYVVVKRNNILLSVLMHGMLNTFSAVQGYQMAQNGDLAEAAAASNAAINLSTIGALMLAAFAAPFFIVIGLMLISPKTHRYMRFVFAGIASAVLLFGGLGLNVASFKSYPVSLTVGYAVTEEGETQELPVTLAEGGHYNVYMLISNAKGNYYVSVVDSNGEIVCATDLFEGAMTMDMDVTMDAGDYIVVVEAREGAVGDNPQIVFKIG